MRLRGVVEGGDIFREIERGGEGLGCMMQFGGWDRVGGWGDAGTEVDWLGCPANCITSVDLLHCVSEVLKSSLLQGITKPRNKQYTLD